jgi:hypothetical protein
MRSATFDFSVVLASAAFSPTPPSNKAIFGLL